MRSLEDIEIEKDRVTLLIADLMTHLETIEKELEEKRHSLERENLGYYVKGKLYRK